MNLLVLNWDQTGCQLVPGGEWTMEKRGENQVSINGLEDKCQVTLLLCVTKMGNMLPPQMIYAGKTDCCLPKADFPEDWNVTYTESHWSNEDSMIEFIDKVLVSYVQQIRESLPLTRQVNQKAIAIFDVFKAHRSEKVQTHLKSKGILPQFVPACCTDKLQPVDLSVSKP